MSPTIEDLRATLDTMAEAHAAPVPQELLQQLRSERSARTARRRCTPRAAPPPVAGS